jgi:ferritin-like metal-binding protein YciE
MAAAATQANPITDLMYDWLTVLRAKAEGINAYEKYIQDAEEEGASECAKLFRQLHDEDVRQVHKIKDHLAQMVRQGAFNK